MSQSFRCRACDGQQYCSTHIAIERQFSAKGEFLYRECSHCGSLSIDTVPTDLARHYPSEYYSYQTREDSALSLSLKKRIFHWLTGELAVKRRIGKFLQITGIQPNARILDIGSGSGHWLHQLSCAGYQNLTGLDPYLSTTPQSPHGVQIRRGNIHTADDNQDLICYHHVLEHIPDPRAEIAAAVKRLKPGGYLLIRVPVADSWARRKFQTCWVQWDAPRHLWLPTRAALSLIAQENHLTEVASLEDSCGSQVWTSRRYRANLTGQAGKYTPFNRNLAVLATLPSILASIAWSSWLNLRQQGDQVAVLWQRPLTPPT